MAWDQVPGQEIAKRLLQAHVASGRMANAYLLAGPDGVGKRTLSIEAAKALNCTASAALERPCDACRSCAQITKGTHPDIHCLTPGGASAQIRIDEIRQLLGRIALQPFSARMQVAVIDGADRLTEEAANSLLKALEEPPAHTRFILTTSHLADCLPTIVSRCQLIRCRPRPAASVVEEPLLKRLASPEPAVWLEEPLPETRQEVAKLLDGMMSWLRDLAVTAAAGDTRWAVHTDQDAVLRRQAARVSADRCAEAVFELVSLRESIDQFANPRLVAALAREKWLALSVQCPVSSDQ